MTDSQPTRAIDLSVEVPGTPEEVWAAIATGPGITSWFVPFEVAEHEGGPVAMDFGAYGIHPATVTAWEPPHRFRYDASNDMAGDAEGTMGYEWLVEARDGGGCVVRLVNSGFGEGDDWDDQYDAMGAGWGIFLQNLRVHLTHFRGRAAHASVPTVLVPGPGDAAWSALCEAIGVPTDLAAGDRIATGGEGVPVLTGTVDVVQRAPMVTAYVVVVDGPAPGNAFITAEGDGEQVACSVYTYLYGDDPAATADPWTPFLTTRWPAAAAQPTA